MVCPIKRMYSPLIASFMSNLFILVAEWVKMLFFFETRRGKNLSNLVFMNIVL